MINTYSKAYTEVWEFLNEYEESVLKNILIKIKEFIKKIFKR